MSEEAVAAADAVAGADAVGVAGAGAVVGVVRVRRSAWLPARLSSLPVVGAVAGLGWHFSTVLLRPDRAVQYPERLVRLDGDRAWFTRTRFAEQPGSWGVRWPGGQAVVGPPLLRPVGPPPGDVVCRTWFGARPAAASAVSAGGWRVGFDCVLHDPDPGVHGLDFDEVVVPGPLGGYPAWFVPAEGAEAGRGPEAGAGPEAGRGPEAGAGPDTWVITVHGRGMDRRECLRVLPVLHRAGLPVLAISYRNDVGAPPSPDGFYHLGDTEWRDLEAAVRFAVGAGARRVVLYGWSMGAAISGAFLSRSELADRVAAVVWDCPVVDWWATLRRQAALRRLPPALIRVVAAFTKARAGIDFNRFELRRRPPAHRPPTLVFHGALDSSVPARPVRALAAAARGLAWPLRYVEVPGAEHTATWNADPQRYERALTEFLAGLSPTLPPTSTTVPPGQWHDGVRD